MYLQEILEVAIGLVFIWLVISVGAMAVQEWIANQFDWRAKDLEAAIRKTLANPAITKAFYDHQIIRALSKEPDWLNKLRLRIANLFRKIAKRPIRVDLKPSYIPASEFAMTVFDLVMQAGSEASPIKNAFIEMHSFLDKLTLDRMNFEEKQQAQVFLDHIMEEARQVATTDIGQDSIDSINAEINRFAEDHPEIKDDVQALLLDKINSYYTSLLEEQRRYPAEEFDKNRSLKRMRIGLLAMEQTSPKLNELLRGLLNEVEEYTGDKEKAIAVARKNVETWFDDSMSRLSGWYKRKAQLVAFIVGLILAILLNVDSINVSMKLWREPTLRQEIVAQAQAYAQQNQQVSQTGTSQPAATPIKTVADLQNELSVLNIPFGWETTAYFLKAGEVCQIIPISKGAIWGVWSTNVCKQITNAPVDATGWLSKITGLLITALATMQGAPFWFDILKKIVNIRSTGPNPVEQKAGG